MRPWQTRYARLVRSKMMAYCAYLRVHAGRLPYEESRPMRSFPTQFLHMPSAATDCSESSAIVAQASGAPVKWVANREGYTGTALAVLQHIPKFRSRRGDFVVFFTPEFPVNGAHMVILLQGGLFHRDPLVWSHGRPGVDVMPFSAMAAGFPGFKPVFLRAVPHDLKRAA